ncbi:hypothetical protein ACFQ5D_17965 [Paenibacillus farraposensis]|uniref:Uncharacterized protein n=1 Tax=Paenibacillus farraposensis TaxID=2807095 RepID=A0ABW4DEZ4_9BACL|nr:hypothetical protein [Paenibacillus farraposensis]MCC3381918.1 hypothetical protein [Paenibacillus farraposensis]
MAVFTYGHFETNIDSNSELYGYLCEVNEQIGERKLIIECETIKRGFFHKPKIIYCLYADMGLGEYQVIECASGDERLTAAYLLGVLTGIQRGRNNNDR